MEKVTQKTVASSVASALYDWGYQAWEALRPTHENALRPTRENALRPTRENTLRSTTQETNLSLFREHRTLIPVASKPFAS